MLKHSLQKGLECMNVFFTYFRYYKASTVKNIPMLSYTDDEAFRISALTSFILLTLFRKIQCMGYPLNPGEKILELK